jgi:hypothetical protein
LTKGALDYVGEDYKEVKLTIGPRKSIKLKVEGKCAIIIGGPNGWITIKVNGGPRQKVFKLRLLNVVGRLELINESFSLPSSVLLRSTGPIEREE